MKNFIINNVGNRILNLKTPSNCFEKLVHVRTPDFWVIDPNQTEEFHMLRKKLKLFSKKRNLLKKLNQKKVESKKIEILKKRSESLAKYRIDFMPLCCDEDLEMMANLLNKDQEKKSS